MTGADFYLICFAVGFALSLFSFLGGTLHWHLHVPHVFHGSRGHAPLHGANGSPGDTSARAAARHHHVSVFNFASLAAFLAWFGGAGFLLTRFSGLMFATGLVFSVISGLLGALIIFLFFSRVLTSENENLDPADFEMTGALGRLSMPIRVNGTGEIVYSQAGTRRTCGARSENGDAIAKGTEVIVTRYEKGIAFVRRWSEMAGEEQTVNQSISEENDAQKGFK